MSRFKIGDKAIHRPSGKVYTVVGVRSEPREGILLEGYEYCGYFDPSFYSVAEEKPVGVDFTKPVTTRDGRKVRILCTDLKRKDSFTIAAVICDDPALGDFLKYYRTDGTSGSGQTENELINSPVKKYINLFKNDVGRMYYDSREDAEKAGKASNKANPGVGYIKTIEVEL